jgi:two-component system, NtrC family, response regulator HydG
VTEETTDPAGRTKGRILVVDDQRNMRATTAMLLRSEGYGVSEAGSGEEALRLMGAHPVDLLVTDLKMEPMDGMALLKKALETSPGLQAIVMTAFGSIESAVEAMRMGAYDYITKPFKDGELLHRVNKAFERARLIDAVNLFAGEFNTRHGLSALIGKSAPMRELTSLIVRVAASDAAVLIQGESGTGKELVARALHTQSRRKDRPFVPVNCAAITESLLESELFGHAKGAFTGAVRARRGLFEEADGGTLFIDEVTETTAAFQSKLLRVLQDGEIRRVGESTSLLVDVRTVAATNRDITVEVDEKRFRQDLFYRLNVVTLRVPPLRDRLEDLPLLAEAFLERANQRSQRRKRLTSSALEYLQTYKFPGNVRELENLVEQAAALSEGDDLLPEDFPLWPKTKPSPGLYSPGAAGDSPVAASGTPEQPVASLADAVAQAERQAILIALERTRNDLAQVAQDLGISPTTLWRKMKRLNLKAGGGVAPPPSES